MKPTGIITADTKDHHKTVVIDPAKGFVGAVSKVDIEANTIWVRRQGENGAWLPEEELVNSGFWVINADDAAILKFT